MDNNDFLAVFRMQTPLVQVPLVFFRTYEANLPRNIILEDTRGHVYSGEIFRHTKTIAYILTDVRRVLKDNYFTRFCIIRMTYNLNGRFEIIVPNSTEYWKTIGNINGLLPYAYVGIDEVEGDLECAGNNETGQVHENETKGKQVKCIDHDECNLVQINKPALIVAEAENVECESPFDDYENHSLAGYNSSNPDSELLGYHEFPSPTSIKTEWQSFLDSENDTGN